MQKNTASKSGIFNPRALLAFVFCSGAILLAMLAVAGPVPGAATRERARSNGNAKSVAAGSLAPVAAGQWSIASSPNAGSAPTLLSAVSCVTTSDCWAVGRSEIGQTYTNTTLMRWDGSSWKIVPSPSVDKQTNGLVAITCTSSSSCWAVGYTINLQTIQVQTLTLHWDGNSWQIVSSPNVGNGFNALYGVACASDSDCWAVGFENGGTVAQTLIERWDGNSWTIHDSPNVGSQHNVLNAVTCLSSSDCRAVGYSGVAGAKSALVVQWNGTAWTGSTLPNAPLVQEDTLSSVTCNSTSDCWAVGYSYDGTVHKTLVEQWNGTSWTNPVTPNGGADNYLLSVTCASTSDCWAVGNSSNAAVDPQSFDQDLILHWNGSVWLLAVGAEATNAGYASDLAGIACGAGTECWAVGKIQPAGSNRALIERWDGTSWTSVTTPDVPVMQGNYLSGVSCASGLDCWAVGFDFYGTLARSLIMHWDGGSWGIQSSPNTAIDRSNYLSDVSCVSASDCWAVGQSSDTLDRERQALAMHWDGASWSIMNPSDVNTNQAAETVFEAVSCVSTSDCWAAGFSLAQDYQGLVEHWNGVAWVLIPTPPQEKSILYDVTCTSTSDCTAVGVQWTSALTGSGLYQTLVEHWDGMSWSVATSPNTASDQDNILSAVTCASASDCWAVGSFDNYSQALIERWDGTVWNIVPVPQAGGILNAVTCSSTSDCWAAGPYYTPNPPAQTLLLHWDGTSWTKITSPDTNGTQSNNLSGIACASSSQCWAVGQYSAGHNNQTLILRYAPSLPPTNVVSRKSHGNGRTFDIDLPLTGNPGIECRSGGANGDYTLVFTFANTLTNVDGAGISAGTGTVSTGGIDSNDAHNYIVNLTGVANAQYVTVNLTNASDSAGSFSSAVSAQMGVLLGDVDGSGRVDSTDVFQVRNQSLQNANSTNFRLDVDLSGRIDSNDVFVTRQQSLTSLPLPP